MKIDKKLFITKMLRLFELGCYPYINFTYMDKSYQIGADLNSFYIAELIEVSHETVWGETHYNFTSYDFREICKKDSLDELFEIKIDGKNDLRDIWDDIDFVDDSDWKYTYAYHDSVKIINRDIYGRVIEIIVQDESVLYKIDTNADFSENRGNIFVCREEELEYDVRPSYIRACREAYQGYIDRITAV